MSESEEKKHETRDNFVRGAVTFIISAIITFIMWL